MNISKSKFVESKNCPKIFWLNIHHIEEKEAETESQIAQMDFGSSVGELARAYFGKYELVDFPYEEYSKKLSKTQELLKKNTKIIAEATFLTNGICCSVDILRKVGDGYDLIEVKSVNTPKDYHYDDIAFQYHVLRSAGLNIKRAYLMQFNKKYERWGDLDLQQLFILDDITERVIKMNPDIINRIEVLQQLSTQKNEPEIEVGSHCEKYVYGGQCPYYTYCHRNFEVVEELEVEEFENIDKSEIADFLQNFRYPIYFLDFETYMTPIPQYNGLKPWGQTPFQYSLHILHEDGALEHKEYLGYPDGDPRIGLIKQLCTDIPKDACVVAYNMTFEKTRLKELASFAKKTVGLKNRAGKLNKIRNSMLDLMIPFRKKHYETDAMEGSYSIKLVLPALFPNDPDLDYNQLEGIKNGTDAMNTFPALTNENYSTDEIEAKREQLLAYCKLDTLAMVKIFQKLKSSVSVK